MNKLKAYLKSKYNQEDRKAFVFCYVMIGIPFLFFLAFWVYVNADSILTAFRDETGALSMKNFEEIWIGFVDKDGFGWNLGEILWRTVKLWFFVNFLCIVPSLISTYVLYKEIPGHYIFRIIFMIPTVLAGIVWTMIMKYMVMLNGPVLDVLGWFGFEPSFELSVTGTLLATNDTAYVTILLLNMIPHIIGFNMIISGAYARIPGDLFEVGRLDGIGFMREFFTVSLPLIWPTLIITLISNFSTVFTLEGGVFLYTRGHFNTATMGFYIYELTFRLADGGGTGYYGYPAAIGFVVTCMTIPIVLFGKLFLERLVEQVEY